VHRRLANKPHPQRTEVMIVRVFDINKHVFERVDAFTEELECPDLVEPQIIVRGKYAHTNANGKGTDCHPQHECMSLRALRHTWYFHADCYGPSAVLLRSRCFSRLRAM
jgi:hypothetical protein